MGNCLCSPIAQDLELVDQVRKSEAIDVELKQQQKRSRREVKILLLGSGESGKTTVLKQMQILHGHFTPEQKDNYRQQIFMNVFDAMKFCLTLHAEENIDFEDRRLQEYTSLFLEYEEPELGKPYPNRYFEPLKRLWADAGLQKVILRLEVPQNMHYYFLNLDRLFDPAYVPTEQDILQCRGKTIGITETTFILSDFTYRMFDVGGQRSERKKWLHCFEDITATLFLVAISGYDLTLLEDNNVNQMEDALMLFGKMINSLWLAKGSMILFFNKTDLFKQKLLRSPIRRHYSDYKGGDADIEAAQLYFTGRFLELERTGERQIYTHYTCATDTLAMKAVMVSVNDTILKRSLQMSLS